MQETYFSTVNCFVLYCLFRKR